MSDFDDEITVVEDYCVACQGKCTNDDPAEFEHLRVEWEGLVGAWQDRGVTPSDIWSFMASVTLDTARGNGITLDEFLHVLTIAWAKSEEQDEDDDGD